MKKSNRILLIISAVLTAGISGVMNFCLMPAIESTTQGIRCFDMNSFGYTHETAEKFLSLLSDNGRNLYLHAQLPLDFIYPIVYTAFFILAILALGKNKKLPLFVPLLAVSDYIENICTIKMLTTEVLSPSLASFASAVTVTKTMLMYTCFIILAVLFVKWLIHRKKQRNKSAK